MRSLLRYLMPPLRKRVALIAALIVFVPSASHAADTGTVEYELAGVTQDPPQPRYPGWTVDGKGGTATYQSADTKIVYSWLVPQRLRVGETVSLSGHADTKASGLRVDITLLGTMGFDPKDSELHLVADGWKPIGDSKTVRIATLPNYRFHSLTVSVNAVSFTYEYKPVSTDTVPDVVGMPWEQAIAELRRAGLDPLGVTNLGTAPSPDKANRIVAQAPAGRSKKDPNNKRVELTWYDKYEGGAGAPAAGPIAAPGAAVGVAQGGTPPPAKPGPAAKDCPALIAEYQKLQQQDAELQRQIGLHKQSPILDFAREKLLSGIAEMQRTASEAAELLEPGVKKVLIDPITNKVIEGVADDALAKAKKGNVKDAVGDLLAAIPSKDDAQPTKTQSKTEPPSWQQKLKSLATNLPSIPVPESSTAMVKSLEQKRSALRGRIDILRNDAQAQGCTLPDASPSTGNTAGGPQLIGSNGPHDPQQRAAVADKEREAVYALAFWLLAISRDGQIGHLAGLPLIVSMVEGEARISEGTIVVTPSKVGSSKTPLTLTTPEARIKPKGTVFLVSRDAETSVTFVYVSEGAVEIAPVSGGAPFTVNAGQIGMVNATAIALLAPDPAARTTAVAAAPGAPAVSRGHQVLSIAYQECLSRAHGALIAEGYSASPSSGESFVLGKKGNHGAYITCGVGPNNQAEVNVFVATAASRDGGVPGRERERLQQQMNHQASVSAPAARKD